MGEIHDQNEALSAWMIMAILREAEDNWWMLPGPTLQGELEEFACTLLISFGAALRGEEISLISLLSTWLECTSSHSFPHIMVTCHEVLKVRQGYDGIAFPCPSRIPVLNL